MDCRSGWRCNADAAGSSTFRWGAILAIATISILLYARLTVPTFVPYRAELLPQPVAVAAPAPVPNRLALQLGSAAPKGWSLKDEHFEGGVHPRDVFLWYPKGEKTSSTVASTIIASAYERAGLAVVTHRDELLAAAPGAYAGVAHEQ